MSENVKLRQEMERRIAHKVLQEGHKQGFSFSVYNGVDSEELSDPVHDIDAVLKTMFSTDDEMLYFHKGGNYAGWVHFIYGNGNGGLDVISDYTGNLVPIMDEVYRMIDQYS